VTLDPEWDYSFTDGKVERDSTAKSGQAEVFKYGDYEGRKFAVRYVDSATAAIVNSYWSSNTPLQFMREGDTEVFTCMLLNEKTPINKFERPYPDQRSGVIELGSY